MAVEIANPADDARNDVAEAIKQLKGESADVAPEAPSDPPEVEADAPAVEVEAAAPAEPAAPKADHPSDPARYADGTFKPSKTEAAPEKAAPVEKAKTEIPSTDTQAKASVAPSTALAPPAGWTAAEKAEWSKLSPVAQAAVSRREAEIDRGGRQWSEEKRQLTGLIAPVAQEAQRLGISAEEGLNRLIGAHQALQRDPAGTIARLAQSYGVDLAALASNPPAPQAPAAEQVAPQVYHQLSTLEQRVNGFLEAQTQGTIDSFASAHPHFAAVENELLQLIPIIRAQEPGLTQPQILDKAYQQAIWMNPDVRAQLIAEQSQKAETERQNALKAKQAQASRAAVSIRGSSNGAAPPKAPVSTGDIYDDVRAAINQLRQ